MTWLETIGLKLALSWGIPMLGKLIPWVPSQVWEAISAVLRHLAGLDDMEPAANLFQQGTRAVIATTAVPSNLKNF